MGIETLTDSASSSGFQRKVSSAWETLMATGRCEPKLVRDVIFASWQRCIDSAAPHRDARRMLIVPDPVLERAHRRSQAFREIAARVMNSVESTLGASRSVVLVTDADGIILDAYGTRRSLGMAADINLVAGGNCNEIAGGTNAIGTALAIGMPAQVHASEHFYEYCKGWTCAAALVRDPIDRSILGVVDISGSRDTFSPHNLALATSLARQMEGVLEVGESQNRIRLLEWCAEHGTRWHDDGVIVLDAKGRLVSRNEHAAACLECLGLDSHADGQPLRIAQSGNEGEPVWPECFDPEWVRRVSSGGTDLGFMVVLPRHRRAARVARRTTAARPEVSPAEPRSVPGPFDRIVGKSAELARALAKAHKLASGRFPVLIVGETGTGKEELASAMHEASSARAGPFVAINCGAIPAELAASELFGYAEGAYTGSRRCGRAGKFEEAHGGTLLLDEVGELPPEIQVQLLRILQDGTFSRIGENRVRRVDVRILSATNVDLRAAMERGRFRKDLYFRLAAATVMLPPLRERTGDIILLARHFLARLAQRQGGAEKTLDPALADALEAHAWPGNVRELQNAVELMWHDAESDVLTMVDLPDDHRPAPRSGSALVGGLSTLERCERDRIVECLERSRRNLSSAARSLGIARSTLYVKMKKYGLEESHREHHGS